MGIWQYISFYIHYCGYQICIFLCTNDNIYDIRSRLFSPMTNDTHGKCGIVSQDLDTRYVKAMECSYHVVQINQTIRSKIFGPLLLVETQADNQIPTKQIIMGKGLRTAACFHQGIKGTRI